MRRNYLLAAAAMVCVGRPAAAQVVNYAELQDVLGEPVTTSVIGKPQRASDVPASVTIITRDEIRRSPARTIPDLLKGYAGVEVNRWTAGQSDVAVRGGVQTYNARLLVLVNGRQVYLDHYGMTDWNLLGIQLEDIQQIELVRGPAGALFGFNAAIGVVNIITVDPLGRRSASIDAEGGNHGYRRIGGAISLPLGQDVGLRVSGGHRQEDELAIPTALYRPPSIRGLTEDDASAGLAIAADPATRISLDGAWARNRQLELLPSQILAEQRFESESAGATIDHDTGWGSLTGHAYTNWLDAAYGTTTPPNDPYYTIDSISFRNRITVAQASALVRLGTANTLRVGAEYRDNELTSAYQFSHRISYRNGAVSGMLDLHPTDRLALSLAGRIDELWLAQSGEIVQPAVNDPRDYRRSIAEASFNAGAVLRVGNGGQLRLNGGRGVQSPSLADFGLRVTIPLSGLPIAGLVTGDPAINPAIVWSGELGYAQRIGAGIRLDGALFFTRTTSVIATPGDMPDFSFQAGLPPVLVARFANVGAFSTYGVQFSASGRIDAHLGWRANYTWTHVRQDLPSDQAPFSFAIAPRATTPTHVATVAFDYTVGGWSLDGGARYLSATRQFAFLRNGTLQLVPVPQAIGIDAKLGRRITRQLLAYVAGENLGRAAGAYGSPISADRRIRAGLKLDL